MIKHCFRIADRLAAVSCMVLLAGCAGGLAGLEPIALDQSLEKTENRLPGSTAAKERGTAPAEYAADLAKARNLERAGKYDEARPIYQRLVAGYPKRYEAYHRLGAVADHQRRHREAEALYAQAIRLNGSDAELFNDLGYCLYLQGKLEKAEPALLKAVAMGPSNSRYRNNLGLVLGHLGRYDEALEEFRRGGGEADAYYNLAFVRASREDVDGAKECFRRALNADPDHERARRALASFESYEESPRKLADLAPLTDEGTDWVSYVEGDETQAAGSASGDTAVPSDAAVSAARPSTQSLLKRARTLMSRRTAAKRD